MAAPSNNISLLGIRREFANNNYGSSTNFSNVSLGAISQGTLGTVNRLNQPIYTSPRRPSGYSLGDYQGYDHDFDFLLATIKFNNGDALFRPDSYEAIQYGVTAGIPYAKSYLDSTTTYRRLIKHTNKNGRNTTLIGSKSAATDISRNNSVTHTDRGEPMMSGNGPITYDYPYDNPHAHKGSLNGSSKLKDGSTFQVLRIEIDSNGAITDYEDLSTTAFKTNSDYISLRTLYVNNYNYSQLEEGVWILVFNFGKWVYRQGPRNIINGDANYQGIRYSEFQVWKAKIDYSVGLP
jgi:hypothetical protein